MKPSVDMTSLPEDDWLEHALIEDGRAHRAGYIVDDGFSARVAGALPPPATLPAWRKPVVASAGETGETGRLETEASGNAEVPS